MTDPDGGTTSYSYDAADRLISVANPQGQVTSLSYDLIEPALALYAQGILSFGKARELAGLDVAARSLLFRRWALGVVLLRSALGHRFPELVLR